VAQHLPDEDILSLVKRADMAMYDAKHAGGDRVMTS
jgi:PleD family two-component response regulator